MIKNASIATLAMFLSAASPAMATSDAHSLYVNLELALNQTTVGTVIRSISEQTGYEFSYDETLLNKKISKVSVNLKNEHIENVLKEVFKNTGISYKIVNPGARPANVFDKLVVEIVESSSVFTFVIAPVKLTFFSTPYPITITSSNF